jgi:Spy/CpxP family protein refolding chaperone
MGRGEREMGMRLMAMLENDRIKAALGLTDQQSDKLRQILVDTEKSTVKARADLQVHQIELRELLRADKPDRDAVIKKAQEISDLRGQQMKLHLVALLSAKEVLTPEQQKKIRAFIESRRPGMGQGGGGPMFRPGMGGERRGPGRAPRAPDTPKPPAPPNE